MSKETENFPLFHQVQQCTHTTKRIHSTTSKAGLQKGSVAWVAEKLSKYKAVTVTQSGKTKKNPDKGEYGESININQRFGDHDAIDLFH